MTKHAHTPQTGRPAGAATQPRLNQPPPALMRLLNPWPRR
jgi:hypothetical protein